MNPRYLSAILILALGLILGTPAEAQSGPKIVSTGTIVGAIVGIAVGITVIAVVAIHYSKKRTITGCVNSQGSSMTVTDEKDKQVYALSGDTVGVTPGDRMRLEGKKINSKDPPNTFIWNVSKVKETFGVCRP
jgi:hypothetical protein